MSLRKHSTPIAKVAFASFIFLIDLYSLVLLINMSAPERKPSVKGRANLISAAHAAQSAAGEAASTGTAAGSSSTTATATATSTARPGAGAARINAPGVSSSTSRAHSVISVGSGGRSNASTPTLPDASQFGGMGGGEPVQRLKFKPKVPTKRVKQ
jgi:hypothetical protein